MSAIIGSLRADLSMRSVAFNKGVDEATRKLNGLRNNFRRIGRQLQGVGQSLTIGLTAPIAAFGALTLKSAGDFQAAMNKVGAVSGATAGELEDLRNAAKEMGATTQFSASQSADALSFLAMAGFNARQSIDALPGTLQLAASAQMDLADAADIVSNVLSGYGMEVSELARVNDVLVKTFTSANTDLRQLGEAMKYAGPIASAAGVSFEEAAAAIGLMGNAGIQSSMAGTSLRGAIGRILEPTSSAAAAMRELGLSFTDSEGKIISFDQIISQLAPHADDAGLFIELFGQRAGPAMAALVSQGADSLVNLRSELENAGGTAERIASAQMEGFNGAMKRLASAFEAVQIAIAESGLLDFATRMADSLAAMLTHLSTVNPGLLRLGTIVAGVAIAIGPLVLAAGLLATGFAAVAPIIVSMTVPLASLATVAGVVVAAWGPLTQAVDFLRDNIILLSPIIGQLVIALTSSLVPALASAVSGFIGLAAATGTRLVAALRFATAGLVTFKGALISTGIGALVVGIGYAIQKFMQLVDATGGVGNALVALKAIAAEVWERIGLAVDAAGYRIAASAAGIKASIFEALGAVVSQLPSFVNPIIGAYVGAFHAMKAIWSQLPQVMANVVAGAANMVLNGVEQMINFARDALWNFVSGAAALISTIPGVEINVEPLDRVQLQRVEMQATSVSSDVQGAFNEAFNRDYTGDLATGLEDLGQSARGASEELGAMADSYQDAALQPLQTVEALAEAQRMLARDVGETGEELDATTTEAEELETALTDAGNAGGNLGDQAGSGARRAARELENATDKAKELREEMGNVFKDFLKDLASGSVGDAFSNLFDTLKDKAATSFSDLVSGAFKQGGGGLGAIWGGLKQSWAGIKTGIGAIFGGGGLGGVLSGIGGVISSALPIIGAVSAVVSIIKGFSSKKVIGGGIKLGIEGGEISGGTFEQIQKKTFWGLFKKTYDKNKAFDDENAKALQGQVDAVQGSVKTIYGSLGVAVSDATLDAVNLAISRIDTKGLGEDQIQEKIQEIFAEYGDALSNSVGGIGLDLSANLSVVQALLKPLGKAFNIFGGDGVTLSKNLLKASANAAQALTDLAGGMEALGQKTSAFYDRFFTEQEKLANIQAQVDASFAQLGLSVPATDEAFKQLVLSQNLMTEAGRAAYNALLDIAPQFDTLTDAAQQAADAIAQAAAAERDLVASMRDDRRDVLFDLLSDPQQLNILRNRIASVFGNLGLDAPDTRGDLRAVIRGLDLSTEAGRAAWEAISAIVPDFERVIDAQEDAAQAQREAAREQREALADLRADRTDTVFDLLPEEKQLQILKKRVRDTFADLGLGIPKTTAGLAKVLGGLNLTTDVGKSAYEAIKAIIPAFEKLQDVADAQKEAAQEAANAFRDAIADMRGEYSLDASRYTSEFEAKLAHELGNQDQYAQDVIDAQNTELRRQSALLDRVVGLLTTQNKLSGDSLLLAGMA